MNTESIKTVPFQIKVPWVVAFSVSWGSLRRRIFRSMITMIGVVLGIAFLTYMLVNESIVKALVAMKNDAVNVLLQKAGVDILQTGTDTMMLLLIWLSLLTCLVGIINAMLMAVAERIKEIGTLKCLGAEDGFIVKTYFIESSLQGVLGTVCGALVGLLVAVVMNAVAYGGFVFRVFPWQAVVRAELAAFLIGSIMSVLASIAPAYWAARKQPVDAMRVEE
ncbi:MAG: FtsX-like permease family protein [Kiritimatiellae bacterium]|nr:FtsX-like permease family protein [Kiritimatiellia bacterium]